MIGISWVVMACGGWEMLGGFVEMLFSLNEKRYGDMDKEESETN